MLLTNLLVTVLQSTEVKRGDQNQLAVRVKWGKQDSEGTCCGPAGLVMWIKAAENGLSLCYISLLPQPCSVYRPD